MRFLLLNFMWLMIVWCFGNWNIFGLGLFGWVRGVIVFILINLKLSVFRVFRWFVFLFRFVVSLIGFGKFNFIICIGNEFIFGVNGLSKFRWFNVFRLFKVRLWVCLGGSLNSRLWIRLYIWKFFGFWWVEYIGICL